MGRQHRRCETCRPYDRCGFWKDGGPEDGRD